MIPEEWVHSFLLPLSLISVPMVHIFASHIIPRRMQFGATTRPKWSCSLSGGVRSLVFTIMSWLTWAISLGFTAYAVTQALSVPIPTSNIGVFYGAASACSIVGFVFAVTALLVFEMRPKNEKKLKTARVLPPKTGFVITNILGMVLALMSATILIAANDLPDSPSRLLYCTLSVACGLIAASLTHGLGGYLHHAQESHKPSEWHFFQPFKGGQVFVATQGFGWTLFALFIVCLLKIMQELLHGVTVALRWWAFGTGGMILVTQMILGLSIATFRNSGSKNVSAFAPLKKFFEVHAPIVLLYMPTHIFVAIFIVTIVVLPTYGMLLFWMVALSAYYTATSFGNPSCTGCRKWSVVRRWFYKNLSQSMKSWQNQAQLIYTGKTKPNAGNLHIMGFHPHGVYPLGAVAVPLLSGFEEIFPGGTPATLAASSMFIPPIQRDLLHWWGVREVSKPSFIRALQEEKSVIVCPGGQEELVETYKIFHTPSTLMLCTRHKGFCRIAIEQQAHLVPILALGEALTVRNVLDMPKLQMMTYRYLGFPIPYLVVGRWGMSPLPKKMPLLYIMGEPIKPPYWKPGDTVQQEDVDHLHQRYYDQLVRLFHEFKNRHPHYSNTEICLKSSL